MPGIEGRQVDIDATQALAARHAEARRRSAQTVGWLRPILEEHFGGALMLTSAERAISTALEDVYDREYMITFGSGSALSDRGGERRETVSPVIEAALAVVQGEIAA